MCPREYFLLLLFICYVSAQSFSTEVKTSSSFKITSSIPNAPIAVGYSEDVPEGMVKVEISMLAENIKAYAKFKYVGSELQIDISSDDIGLVDYYSSSSTSSASSNIINFSLIFSLSVISSMLTKSKLLVFLIVLLCSCISLYDAKAEFQTAQISILFSKTQSTMFKEMLVISDSSVMISNELLETLTAKCGTKEQNAASENCSELICFYSDTECIHPELDLIAVLPRISGVYGNYGELYATLVAVEKFGAYHPGHQFIIQDIGSNTTDEVIEIVNQMYHENNIRVFVGPSFGDTLLNVVENVPSDTFFLSSIASVEDLSSYDNVASLYLSNNDLAISYLNYMNQFSFLYENAPVEELLMITINDEFGEDLLRWMTYNAPTVSHSFTKVISVGKFSASELNSDVATQLLQKAENLINPAKNQAIFFIVFDSEEFLFFLQSAKSNNLVSSIDWYVNDLQYSESMWDTNDSESLLNFASQVSLQTIGYIGAKSDPDSNTRDHFYSELRRYTNDVNFQDEFLYDALTLMYSSLPVGQMDSTLLRDRIFENSRIFYGITGMTELNTYGFRDEGNILQARIYTDSKKPLFTTWKREMIMEYGKSINLPYYYSFSDVNYFTLNFNSSNFNLCENVSLAVYAEDFTGRALYLFISSDEIKSQLIFELPRFSELVYDLICPNNTLRFYCPPDFLSNYITCFGFSASEVNGGNRKRNFTPLDFGTLPDFPPKEIVPPPPPPPPGSNPSNTPSPSFNPLKIDVDPCIFGCPSPSASPNPNQGTDTMVTAFSGQTLSNQLNYWNGNVF